MDGDGIVSSLPFSPKVEARSVVIIVQSSFRCEQRVFLSQERTERGPLITQVANQGGGEALLIDTLGRLLLPRCASAYK